MRNPPAREKFDYDQLVPELAEQARAAASRVRDFVRASVIDVGRELLAVKAQLEHGQFLNWLGSECDLRVRTAQRLMQVAEAIGKNDNLSYLPPDGLLAISARSAPAPVVTAIVERINSGARPTTVEIKREITAARRQVRPARPNAVDTRAGLNRATGTENCGAAAAGTCAKTRSSDYAVPSIERQVAELMQAWAIAGPEARELFLAAIGARISASAEQDAVPPSAVTAALPSSTAALGSAGDGASVTEDEQPTPPVNAVSRLERADGDGAVANWVGRRPPPEVTCNTPKGECRYRGCYGSWRCLMSTSAAVAA